jgi:hypothetical protein
VAAEALLDARLARALDDACDDRLNGADAGTADTDPTRTPARSPAARADAILDHVETAAALPTSAVEQPREPLVERLRGAETEAEARQRAARALEWALLAQRRRVDFAWATRPTLRAARTGCRPERRRTRRPVCP